MEADDCSGILAFGTRRRPLSALFPYTTLFRSEISEIKLLIMLGIFVYAFFTFSWAMRQYNFASVLFGSAPLVGEKHVSRSEEHTSELQSRPHLVCRLLLEKKKTIITSFISCST